MMNLFTGKDRGTDIENRLVDTMEEEESKASQGDSNTVSK